MSLQLPSKQKPLALRLGLFAFLFLLVACKMPAASSKNEVRPQPVGPGVPRSVLVSWTANRETAVNSAGGGYNVYYSSTSGFSVPGGTAVNVPFVSGTAPTSTTLSLVPGTYYIRVAAYSTLKTLSSASGQIPLVVPSP